jgi:adenosylcobinamide kinase/adenosylcobinamide-phosphate guanylyltransferase
MRTLVLGGARSGKSEHAERLLDAYPVVHYIATGPPATGDAEWSARVALHRARRPPSWVTVETTDLVAAMRDAAAAEVPVLIEDLPLWTTGVLDRLDAWEATVDARVWAQVERELGAAADAWGAFPHPAVAVSAEVGLGVVPDTKAGRVFRDMLGTVNRMFADRADRACLLVAGIPLDLK